MKYSPDLLKAVDHCQHRSFVTNRYTGQRIAVDCGHIVTGKQIGRAHV